MYQMSVAWKLRASRPYPPINIPRICILRSRPQFHHNATLYNPYITIFFSLLHKSDKITAIFSPLESALTNNTHSLSRKEKKEAGLKNKTEYPKTKKNLPLTMSNALKENYFKLEHSHSVLIPCVPSLFYRLKQSEWR